MIEIRELTKMYGNMAALDSLTVTIQKGTVFGFVGQNGAGKTTAFSILATLLPPTSGDASINGLSVVHQPEKVRAQIGYMPDFFGVYDQLKAGEYLDFYGASYGIPANEREKFIPQLLELVNLSDKMNSYVDYLSRGMKQRLCLARALIHDPEVLILDEPASGLDPRARAEMKEIIKELKSMGKTILISSHILPELAEMCDELGIIDRGKLLTAGPVSEIQQHLTGDKIILVKTGDIFAETVQFFEDDPYVSKIIRNEREMSIQFHYRGTDEDQVILLKRAVENGLPIKSFSELEKGLEDVFLEIMKGAGGNEAID